ncbi:hypothetical protein [Nonomuraea sp. NPDC052265]|uniref:hypothetical protein n=1 Tax=Nonomuraea sp. NPDC052265 TaxID=3364374 RepID=UPI0037C9A02C
MQDATHGLSGRARFAFIERPNVLVLCHRLGSAGWGLQPWQAIPQDDVDAYPPGLPADGRSAAPVPGDRLRSR